MKSLLKQRFAEAKKGKKFFLSIARNQLKQKNKKTAYVFFFEEDNELNNFGLLYLDEFLDFSPYDSAIIISSDSVVANTAKSFCQKIDSIVKVSQKEVFNVISYFTLRHAKSDCYFISLDKPFWRKGSCILGKHGLSKEEIVGIGIYQIMPFRKIEKNEGSF